MLEKSGFKNVVGTGSDDNYVFGNGIHEMVQQEWEGTQKLQFLMVIIKFIVLKMFMLQMGHV
jgi:hypothetical protein